MNAVECGPVDIHVRFFVDHVSQLEHVVLQMHYLQAGSADSRTYIVGFRKEAMAVYGSVTARVSELS